VLLSYVASVLLSGRAKRVEPGPVIYFFFKFRFDGTYLSNGIIRFVFLSFRTSQHVVVAFSTREANGHGFPYGRHRRGLFEKKNVLARRTGTGENVPQKGFTRETLLGKSDSIE